MITYSELEFRKLGIYPVKSAAAIELREAMLTTEGLEGDRQFMVVKREVDDHGIHHFITQRMAKDEKERCAAGTPELALIKPVFRSDSLSLTWKGTDSIPIPFDKDSSKAVRVGIWSGTAYAIGQGDEVADWLSGHLGIEAMLVMAAGPFRRNVSRKWLPNDNTLRFQDGYPIHWFMEESVAELSKLAGQTIKPERFRPNIVARGSDSRIEHLIHSGEVAGIPFLQPKPCDRCPTTTVDQDLGKIAGKEPLQTLAKFMRWRNMEGVQKVIFGENMLPLGSGSIKIGDPITMTARRDPPLEYGPKM